jgi:hypothetical protein
MRDRARAEFPDRRLLNPRYDKLAINFASAVAIAAIIIWWT